MCNIFFTDEEERGEERERRENESRENDSSNKRRPTEREREREREREEGKKRSKTRRRGKPGGEKLQSPWSHPPQILQAGGSFSLKLSHRRECASF